MITSFPSLQKTEQPRSNNLECIDWAARLYILSYDVRFCIRVSDSTLIDQLCKYLPPGWKHSDSQFVDELYSLVVRPSNYYQLFHDQKELILSDVLDNVFDTLDSNLRLQLATAKTDWFFVHAGVVGWKNRAVVIPGLSFSGKTSLVKSLVSAGATYYSDEYAVFTSDGLVHPYPRRLSIRSGDGVRKQLIPVEEFSGISGSEALQVGAIIDTHYQPGAIWSPKTISPGQAALTLLENTVAARLQTDCILPILARVVFNAFSIQSERDEADDTAIAMLDYLEYLFIPLMNKELQS